MNYALLIYFSREQMQALSPEETRSLHGDHEATVSTAARVIAHYRVRPPQTAANRRDGDTITRPARPRAPRTPRPGRIGTDTESNKVR